MLQYYQARSQARSNCGVALTPEQQSLISSAVTILSQIPGLYFPQGTITVIPSVIYLITGTLKESATKPWEEKEILTDSSSVLSCLSALDLAKTAQQEAKLDELSLLLL